MTYKEYSFLKSDENEVLKILEGIAEDDWIARMSFQGRLESIREKLEGVDPPSAPEKAILTFRGKPVKGSESITADFASKATIYFNDAVAAIAASMSDKLGYMGQIADKKENQLLITGMAKGSFGFEYEIPSASNKNEPVSYTHLTLPTKA